MTDGTIEAPRKRPTLENDETPNECGYAVATKITAETTAEPGDIQRRVMIGTLWLTGWRMLTRALGFVSLLALTQLLVPADFGLVALASAVSVAIESLSQLGVRDALVRLRENAEDHFDAAFTFQAGRGLLTGLALAASSATAAKWMGDARLQPILVVLGVLTFIGGLENIGTVTLARRLDFRSQVLLQAGPRMLSVIVTILLALWLRSYWALIAGLALSRVLTTACSYAVAPHRPRLRLHGWRYLLHFSAWSWAGSVAILIWSRSDPFLIGPAVGPAVLGVYVIAAEVALLPVTELIEPVSSALYVGFAMAHRTGTMARDVATRVAMAIAICMAPIALGLSATSGYLAQSLLGSKWAGAQPVIAILALLCVFSPFSYVCGTTLSAQGHIRRAFYCNGLAAALKVTTLLTTLHLTHDLQVIAAITLAVVFVEACLFIWQIQIVTPQRLHDLAGPALRTLVAGTATMLALLFAPGTWAPTELPRLHAVLIGAIIGIAAVAAQTALHAALWTAAGRPDGPERNLAELASRASAKIASRLSMLRRAT